MPEPDDFVWCPVRWGDGHICANHLPSHDTHKCCCGATSEELS